jgi:hypothetical protein
MPGRKEKVIIRVKRGGNESSKKAKQTIGYHDSTQAGRFFDSEKPKYTIFPRKSSSSLLDIASLVMSRLIRRGMQEQLRIC